MPPIHHPRRPAPARRPVLATVRPSALSVGVGNRSGFSPRLVARWSGSWLSPGWSFNPVPAPIAGSIFLLSGHFTENVSPATALAHPVGSAIESVAYDLHLEVTEPAAARHTTRVPPAHNSGAPRAQPCRAARSARASPQAPLRQSRGSADAESSAGPAGEWRSPHHRRPPAAHHPESGT